MATEPPILRWIQERVACNEYLYTSHADQERRNDRLSIQDVEHVILQGSILEEYPDDPRGPSCLIHGSTGGTPVHVVRGRNRSSWLVLITVYIPTAPKWKSPTERFAE